VDAPDIAHPGDSAEQRQAEALILEGLSVALSVAPIPRTFPMGDHIRVSVDGVSDDPAVLVEVWAHQGPPKSAQKAKVITDALNLIWIDRALYEAKILEELGFLEQVGENLKVPMLYRDGLGMTQGKAFIVDDAETEDEDPE
jgi:hypothetical protein